MYTYIYTHTQTHVRTHTPLTYKELQNGDILILSFLVYLLFAIIYKEKLPFISC